METASDHAPESVAALQAQLAQARAALDVSNAELAVAKAQNADDLATITHQKLVIFKLQNELRGSRSERQSRVLDQNELEFEEIEATATEDEPISPWPPRQQRSQALSGSGGTRLSRQRLRKTGVWHRRSQGRQWYRRQHSLGAGELGDVAGVLIILADMPVVTDAHVRSVVETATSTASIVCTQIGRKLMPPVLIGHDYFATLRTLSGDQGAKGLFSAAGPTSTTSPLLQI